MKAVKEAVRERFHPLVSALPEEMKEALGTSRPFQELIKEHFLQKYLTETDAHKVAGRMEQGDKSFLMVDVRAKKDFDEAHIKGAFSLPYDEIESRNQELSDDKELIVYCYSGECMLGAMSAFKLATLGVYVREMNTGWAEWVEKGYPTGT
jgi:rhodanese-related sulfurtransferase